MHGAVRTGNGRRVAAPSQFVWTVTEGTGQVRVLPVHHHLMSPTGKGCGGVHQGLRLTVSLRGALS